VLVVLLLHRLRLPTVTGFLVSGMLLGPHGLSLVSDIERIEIFAEVGVMLLLFTVGIEFSLAIIRRLMGTAFLGGLIPIAIWGLLGYLAAPAIGLEHGQGVFAGFLLSLSSTVIPLKALADAGQVDSPHGRAVTAVAVFQDLLVVPMMLLTPFLAAGGVAAAGDGSGWTAPVLALLKAGIVIAGVLVVALWVVPRVLASLTALRSREVFIISVFLLCIGTAWITSEVGLSLALGAFLAGLVVSESEYGHQALADVMPFRDSLTSLFFVSVGMLIDPAVILSMPFGVLAAVAVVVLIKPILIGGMLLVSGRRPTTAVQSAFLLAQVGEFSLVLMRFGTGHEVLPGAVGQVILSAAVLTMIITPLILAIVPRLEPYTRSWEERGWWRPSRDLRIPAEGDGGAPRLANHVIIVGYGFNGRNLARVLKEIEIPYVVLEMNSQTVRAARAEGESILYGDAASAGILERLGAREARAMVLAISDPVSTRRAVAVARREFPALHIIVRTRYLMEVDELYRLGAQVVIPEEVETSMEIFARVLEHYGVPRDALVKHARRIRTERYEVFRPEGRQSPGQKKDEPEALAGLKSYLSAAEVQICSLPPRAAAAGRTLRELDMRRRTGSTVLAVMRDGSLTPAPPADMRLEVGDSLVMVGKPDQIGSAIAMLMEGAWDDPGGERA